MTKIFLIAGLNDNNAYIVVFTQTLCNGEDVIQGQFFKWIDWFWIDVFQPVQGYFRAWI